MSVRVLEGDCIDVLRTLPASSVHMCVTSPPYYGLRDYGVAGQIGLEATPELWVAKMVAVFAEVRRVLRPDATLWINIGDSYAGSGKGPSNSLQADASCIGKRGSTSQFLARSVTTKQFGDVRVAGLKPKDLIGIPWMLAFALRADGWYLRSEIIWAKPNPMPESVTDRPTKAHEQLFLLSKSRTYFYDADSVREESTPETIRTSQYRLNPPRVDASRNDGATLDRFYNPAGRNKRSVWTVATEAFPESHFATYPTALIEPCIKASTSERGCCAECGAPWARVVERAERVRPLRQGKYTDTGANGTNRIPGAAYEALRQPDTTTGWRPSCKHDAEPVPATVLDPFFGAGTTGLVSDRLGRSCIGIELNPEYAEMARKRISGDNPMFTEVA